MYTCLPQFTPLRHNGTLSQKILFLALKFSVVVTTMIYCFGEFKDFCNALLSGSSQDFIDRLVKVPNNQKGVYRPSKFNHVLPLLYNLHWFPEERKKKKKKGITVLSDSFWTVLVLNILLDFFSCTQLSEQLRCSSSYCGGPPQARNLSGRLQPAHCPAWATWIDTRDLLSYLGDQGHNITWHNMT